MPRQKTHSERAQIITRIIGLVKVHGRITMKNVVAMIDLYRITTKSKE
ncbi:DUF977 family protein [Enterobacter ludwigii]